MFISYQVRVTHLHDPRRGSFFPKWGNEGHDPLVYGMIKTVLSLGDRFIPTDWPSEGMQVGNPKPKKETVYQKKRKRASVGRSLSDVENDICGVCDQEMCSNNVKHRNGAEKASLTTTQSEESNDMN